jgi:hypothetical protein
VFKSHHVVVIASGSPIWGKVSMDVDTSPTSLIVILLIKLCTDHCCPSNRTEHKGIRGLNGKQLIRDWPNLVTSSNCRYRPADATSAQFLWRYERIVWKLGEEPLCGRSLHQPLAEIIA